MVDRFGREINYMRVSVTDRCNLRCAYCMPGEGVQWLPHEDILSYEQIRHLVKLGAQLGVQKVRLTGGEPLVRKDLHQLVRSLREIDGIEAVSLTTNGVLLGQQLPGLLEAGLSGVNISLDTLDREQYEAMTRRDELVRVCKGLSAALQADNLSVKINCVPTEENRNQVLPLVSFARTYDVAVRFIELMPIGLGRGLRRRTEADLLAQLEAVFGPAQDAGRGDSMGPCRYVTFPGFKGRVGFISAMTHAFCSDCNRIRLTATGRLKACLQYENGAELKPMLDRGADDKDLLDAMRQVMFNKPACHHFSEGFHAGDEVNRMYQIGG